MQKKKEEHNDNYRLDVLADDTAAEEKSKCEMETKNGKLKMTKEKGIKMNDKRN